LNRVLDGSSGRARQFNLLVNMILHGGLPSV
jgi:hypothetical protein